MNITENELTEHPLVLVKSAKAFLKDLTSYLKRFDENISLFINKDKVIYDAPELKENTHYELLKNLYEIDSDGSESEKEEVISYFIQKGFIKINISETEFSVMFDILNKDSFDSLMQIYESFSKRYSNMKTVIEDVDMHFDDKPTSTIYNSMNEFLEKLDKSTIKE